MIHQVLPEMTSRCKSRVCTLFFYWMLNVPLAAAYLPTQALQLHRDAQTSSSTTTLLPPIILAPKKAPHDPLVEVLTITTEKRIISSPRIQHRDTSFDLEDWKIGFTTPDRQSSYELSGSFPTDLTGTFFQNGHAKFKVGDETVFHPFDADGMVTAVTFNKGKAWFRNRYVETPGYLKDLQENRICSRGIFGTAKNKGAWYSNIFDLKIKNCANTFCFGPKRSTARWIGSSRFGKAACPSSSIPLP
jgi:hypothetical protein